MIIPSASTSRTTVMKMKTMAARRGATTEVGSVTLMAALINQTAEHSKRIVVIQEN
jgi:hypothetical protein